MGFRRNDRVVFEVSGERAVLLDEAGTALFTLNPVGSLVWHAIDGHKDAAALAAELISTFTGGVTEAQLAEDITTFLGELEAAGLVTPNG